VFRHHRSAARRTLDLMRAATPEPRVSWRVAKWVRDDGEEREARVRQNWLRPLRVTSARKAA
jgi:hypothetical protein